MEHNFNITYLTLVGHVEIQKYRYLYFTVAFIVYSLTVLFNSVVILVIYTHKCLHEPMYIFIAALLLNTLLESTVFFPKLLVDLLSEHQSTSYSACIFQAFLIYTFAASEFTLLSAMSYDRYVSICKPLQYHTLIKQSTVKMLLFLSWFFPASEIGVMLILTNRLKLCKFELNRIYCDNYSIVKSSCDDTTVNNIYGVFILIFAVVLCVVFVLFTYTRILSICLRRSKEFRQKAVQTCLPHLLIFIIISISGIFEIVNQRLESKIPKILNMIISVHFVLPAFFNPIIYGLNLREISKRISKLLCLSKNNLLRNFG